MKNQKLVRCLTVVLSLGLFFSGCSQQEAEISSVLDSSTHPEESSQMNEEESATSQETEKVDPDPGIELTESQSSSEITASGPSVAEYRKRYPGDLSGMIQFYVVDSQGNPVQNARLGFTSSEAYAEAERLSTEMGTNYDPSEDFAARINAFGIAKAGLIEFDPVTGGVVKGLPQNVEVRVTQRKADGEDVDSIQWVTLTWENTVPSYTIQIDEPNAYAGYAEAKDRVQIVLIQDGKPAEGVFVKLLNQNQKETPDYGGLQLDRYIGFTDQDGILYLTKIPDGDYKVCAGTIAKQQTVSTIEITEQNRIFQIGIKGTNEKSSIPNPDIGANPSPKEIELGRNAWNLQEHLKEVLPLESYLYVSKDYVNSDGGDLIIGVVDEETVRSAVDSYTGAPCRQVIYQPAECSLAQVMDLSRAIADLDFPDQTTAHTLPAEAWKGEGIDVIICADEDADADWIESEVLRLADEQEFPEEYIYFGRREGMAPLPPGVNPDT